MSHPLLQLDGFCVAYRTVEAVHSVRLQVNEGEIVTVIAEGTPEQVQSNPRVLDAYLGGSDEPIAMAA